MTTSMAIVNLVLSARESVMSILQVNPDLKDWMSPDKLRSEMLTCRIHLHRRAGHTTAAIQLLEAIPEAVLLVQNQAMLSVVKSNFRNAPTHRIHALDYLNKDGRHFGDVIIFDNVSDSDETAIMRVLRSASSTAFLVFLG